MGYGSVYREQTRRAAKAYRCDECRQPIVPGEAYCSWFQLFDGAAYGGHTCLICNGMRAEAWAAFGWSDPEEAAPLGELRLFLTQEHGLADPDAWYAERVALHEAEHQRQALMDGATAAYQAGSPAWS